MTKSKDTSTMTTLTSLLLLFVCSFAAASRPNVLVPTLDGRIVGGETVDVANFPYQLSLRLNGAHQCGAVIIGSNWALSAAHCVVGFPGTFSIRSGSSMLNSGGMNHNIARMIVHANYNPSTFDFDIMAIQISSSFNLGAVGVQSIALPSPGQRPADGVNAVVSGWGLTSEDGFFFANQLQAVTVPIVSQANCRSSYGTAAITDRMICAGFLAGGRDACQGDSGGPLVVGNTLVGIVSWGRGCARPNFPGVYACTGNLRNWILSATGI